MTTSCLSLRADPVGTPAPRHAQTPRGSSGELNRPDADQNSLWSQDLTAARNLLNQRQYAQALVLAGALQRLHGDRNELCDVISACRSQLELQD